MIESGGRRPGPGRSVLQAETATVSLPVRFELARKTTGSLVLVAAGLWLLIRLRHVLIAVVVAREAA